MKKENSIGLFILNEILGYYLIPIIVDYTTTNKFLNPFVDIIAFSGWTIINVYALIKPYLK